MNISGRAVLWLSKPKPFPYKLWYYPGVGTDIINEQLGLIEDADIKLRTGNVLDLLGKCEMPKDAGCCPFADICFSPNRDEHISSAFEEFIVWHK